MLSVDVEKELGAFSVAARFESSDRVTALFGPSGSGKTSIVNMIAGLVRPDRGRIVCEGEVVFDSERRIDVPAHRRHFGYVFQDGRLFPHLTIAGNLDYGRRMWSLPRDAAGWDRIVAMLELGNLLGRRPGKLSGGERQRVAIGRALMMQPRLLLLDEPMASLDDARRAEILPYLERLRDTGGIPMVYVSHRATEVKRLAKSVVRIERGKVAAVGDMELLAGAEA